MSSEVRAELVLGSTERERLIIRILDAHHEAGAGAYGHWLDAVVSIRAGGFTGEFACTLQPRDFERLAGESERAFHDLRSVASFATLEGQLAFRLEGDGLGHFRVHGEARDEGVNCNRLTWVLQLDQTYLPALIASAREIARL